MTVDRVGRPPIMPKGSCPRRRACREALRTARGLVVRVHPAPPIIDGGRGEWDALGEEVREPDAKRLILPTAENDRERSQECRGRYALPFAPKPGKSKENFRIATYNRAGPCEQDIGGVLCSIFPGGSAERAMDLGHPAAGKRHSKDNPRRGIVSRRGSFDRRYATGGRTFGHREPRGDTLSGVGLGWELRPHGRPTGTDLPALGGRLSS